MRAVTEAGRAAAARFCVLLTLGAPAVAQPPRAVAGASPPVRAEVIAAKPTAEFDAQWGSPDHMLFLPVIYAELAGRN